MTCTFAGLVLRSQLLARHTERGLEVEEDSQRQHERGSRLHKSALGKRAGKQGAQAKVVPIRGRRTLSAAARKRMAAAQKARWARVKAGKKTA